MTILKPPARCCKCGSREKISPWMGRLLWICEDCLKKEAEKLKKDFEAKGIESGRTK